MGDDGSRLIRSMRLGVIATVSPGPGPGAGEPPLSLGAWAGAAEAAERAGFASFWVEEAGPTASSRPSRTREALTVLGALAVRTRTLLLGAVPGAGEQRSPAILTRLVTGLDVISHGRALLAQTDDPDGTDGSDRGNVLAERIQVSRAVLEDPQPTFRGRHFVIDGAVNRPAPVQAAGVPIVAFVRGEGEGRPEVLGAAGRLADGVVAGGDPTGWLETTGAVLDESRRAGRPEGAVALVWRADLESGAVAELEAQARDLADEAADRIGAGATGCLVGVDLGGHPDRPSPAEVVELIGRVVGPALS